MVLSTSRNPASAPGRAVRRTRNAPFWVERIFPGPAKAFSSFHSEVPARTKASSSAKNQTWAEMSLAGRYRPNMKAAPIAGADAGTT